MSVAYQVLITIVVTFVFVFSVITIVSMSVNWKNYKYYKKTYDAIRNCQYVMVSNRWGQQSYLRPEDTNPYSNDEIIFFLEGSKVDSIKLLSRGSNYIHTEGFIDLYSRYWFKKIVNARDKYNHQLWVSTTQQETREREYITRTYLEKQPFKFLRG